MRRLDILTGLAAINALATILIAWRLLMDPLPHVHVEGMVTVTQDYWNDPVRVNVVPSKPDAPIKSDAEILRDIMARDKALGPAQPLR